MKTPKKNENSKEENSRRGGVKWYREKIIDVIDKISDEKLLKRIYDLAEYLYIHK